MGRVMRISDEALSKDQPAEEGGDAVLHQLPQQGSISIWTILWILNDNLSPFVAEPTKHPPGSEMPPEAAEVYAQGQVTTCSWYVSDNSDNDMEDNYDTWIFFKGHQITVQFILGDFESLENTSLPCQACHVIQKCQRVNIFV